MEDFRKVEVGKIGWRRVEACREAYLEMARS